MDAFDHGFLSGLFGDIEITALWGADAQLAHMLTFEGAFTRAMGAAGRFDPAMAKAAAAHIAGVRIEPSQLRDGMASDGVPVPALVRLLKSGAGDAAPAIHAGATSQDVMDTALALTLQATTHVLDGRLAQLIDALAQLSDTQGQTALLGRTRMQAALPITVADRIRSWRMPLIDHRARLDLARAQTELLSLAGPVGVTDFNGVAAAMAQALGLTAQQTIHSDRSGIVSYAATLALMSGTLGKLGQDAALMAQQGLDELALRSGGASSAMPHKQNPVLAELLVTLARFNAGQAGLMQQAMVHEQERSGAAWALEWMVLPQMAQATGRALTAAQELVSMIDRIGTPQT